MSEHVRRILRKHHWTWQNAHGMSPVMAWHVHEAESTVMGAGVQITAEQILREAKELQEQDFKPPKQKISDPAELAEYRLRKRKEFEDLVRRVRWNLSVWIKVRFHQMVFFAQGGSMPAC